MESRAEATLFTLLGIAKKCKKKYCYPRQSTVEKSLKSYHQFPISNRTLNRDLRKLEDEGYIRRTKRTYKPKNKPISFTSSLYRFRAKTFNWLFSLQNQVKRLFTHFRLPKWADNQLVQKRASISSASSGTNNVVIEGKDGSVWSYNHTTGERVVIKAPA